MTAIKFGTDGWRGVIAEDFTFENARIVAQSIARYVVRCEDARKGVIIGYDHRFASDAIATAVAEVLSASGTSVFLMDKPCPTPTVSLLVRQRAVAGGLMITASHNPYQWNGIKYKASYGSSALPSIVAQIEKELDVVQQTSVSPLPARKNLIQPMEPREPYLTRSKNWWTGSGCAARNFASSRMSCMARPRACSLNFSGAMASLATKFAARAIRASAACTRNRSSHTSKRCARRCSREKFDAGLCADGDGDRIGAIDRDGAFVNPHQIFALLVCTWRERATCRETIAKTFSVTKLIDKLAAKFGRKLHETPIGFKYICELMLEQNILIGGEESGGIGHQSLHSRTRRHGFRAVFSLS